VLPPITALEESNSNGEALAAQVEELAHIEPAELAGIQIAVVADPRNERVTPEGFYSAEIGRWREWLAELGGTLTEPEEADLLVVPHGICLTRNLGALVRSHLEAGGGLITTGALGARDDDCQPLADTLLANLLGAEAGDIAPLWDGEEGAYFAVLPEESELGAGIPPAARIEIHRADQLVFRGSDRELYYSDYERRPVSRGGEEYFDGAALRALVGEGRVVALGFALTQLEPEWSELVGRALVANAAIWATGQPPAQLRDWPLEKP
jgi:hypothetical protein